ncbi:MAG: hypothetical protein D6714_16575 [Bacteroidetes bacterium]|nr:MAG: hypothetical protein D6714_16575 [Bacteroidota bacterium]
MFLPGGNTFSVFSGVFPGIFSRPEQPQIFKTYPHLFLPVTRKYRNPDSMNLKSPKAGKATKKAKIKEYNNIKITINF